MTEVTLRAQVKFALHCQPGQTSAALNGDAYAIHTLAHLSRKVPPEWLDLVVEADLYRESAADGGAPQKGVNALQLHEWAAAMVTKADPSFGHGAHHLSRSRNAREIKQSLAEWVRKPLMEEEDVIEITT